MNIFQFQNGFSFAVPDWVLFVDYRWAYFTKKSTWHCLVMSRIHDIRISNYCTLHWFSLIPPVSPLTSKQEPLELSQFELYSSWKFFYCMYSWLLFGYQINVNNFSGSLKICTKAKLLWSLFSYFQGVQHLNVTPASGKKC